MSYHVNKKGLPVECNSDGEDCKFGDYDEHFDTIEEAEEFASSLLRTEFSFMPNVQYNNALIPDEDVIATLSHVYSEIYVAAKYVKNIEIEPIILLGKNEDDESVYHCVYLDDELYYDINGVIAYHEQELEYYIKDKYEIVSHWTYIKPDKSIEMIEKLVGVDIRGEHAVKNMKSYLVKELAKSSSLSNEEKEMAISFILKEFE